MLQDVDGVDRANKIEKLQTDGIKLSIDDEDKIGIYELVRGEELKTLVQIYVDPDDKLEKAVMEEITREDEMLEISL